MKTTSSQAPVARPTGFTLVELLIVVAIIALLAGVAIPVYNVVILKARKLHTQTLASSLVSGAKSFYTEYSHFPLPKDAAGGETTPIRSDEEFTGALMGTDIEVNPRHIKFLPDVRDVSDTRSNGLVTTGDSATIVDAWGEMFYIFMDADYNGEIDNPNQGSGSPKLYQTVLAYSAGVDKDPATWEDNLTTWGSNKASSQQNNMNAPGGTAGN